MGAYHAGLSIKPIDIIPGTKVQYKSDRHQMTSAFLTLMKGQDHTTRSKVTDAEVSAFSECFLLLIFLFQTYCENLPGAHLLEVESTEENSFIVDMMKAHSG